MISYKEWSICAFLVSGFLLICFGAVTVFVDPYFHYHMPVKGLEYRIANERYQNDGIGKHFQYNAVITGTSMTQNFKTTEFDEYFGMNSIKLPFVGASYKEINENLQRAVRANPNIKMILRGLDYGMLIMDKDAMNYDNANYPWYLYDDFLWNDVEYVLNKSVFFEETLSVLDYTRAGGKTTSFDAYNSWSDMYLFGKEAVDATYTRGEKSSIQSELSEEDMIMLRGNLRQNIIDLVEENPQIEFFLFFTPYSIYYWDSLNQAGLLKRQLDAEKIAVEMLLEYENIHLFSFFDEFDMIKNLDNYKDIVHYGEWINSQMIEWMCYGQHQLTKKNYEEYCERVSNFYLTYNYEDLFH